MVCEHCRVNAHDLCPQGTWCDCQHKAWPRDDEDPDAVETEPDYADS